MTHPSCGGDESTSPLAKSFVGFLKRNGFPRKEADAVEEVENELLKV
jgi:hypothetical protein